jgi:hypothetical protein
LITAHRSFGLATLAEVKPTVERVYRLVDVLLGSRGIAISREEIANAFTENRGDVRETLFSLYDLVERRQP